MGKSLNKFVKSVHKFTKSVTKTSSKIYRPLTYDKT